MIVQCEACQTRFRLADDKIKEGGTKVRCSKCKEVFTVMPPAPEPAEEVVDFDSFNMEKVSNETPSEEFPESESIQADTPDREEQPTPTTSQPHSEPQEAEAAESGNLDFNSLEKEMATSVGLGSGSVEDFTFADTRQPADAAFTEDEPTDFAASSEETGEPDGPLEFDFSEGPESDAQETESSAADSSTQESEESSDASFDHDADEEDASGESPFSNEADDNTFDFGDKAFNDGADKTATSMSEEFGEKEEFSFENESFSGEKSASEWAVESSDTSFDFEQPQFESDDSPSGSSAFGAEEAGLQFGEIDFAGDNDANTATSFAPEADFSRVAIERQEQPAPPVQKLQSPPSSRDYDDELLPVPPPKKSSLSRILMLLVLMFIILGGAAGFLYVQEGDLNLHIIARYLPFLQEYVGEDPASVPGERIGININVTSYVNGQAGQMLVIQGAAVNNYPATRSAITIKGVLLDDKGKALMQQTVFCGNKLDETALKTLSFTAIEEAMNNQFGDRLSNMNVTAGTAIPFTIVFRNLPAGIASINVEVVDSKPGAG